MTDPESLVSDIADRVIVDACERDVKVAIADLLFTALGFHRVKRPGRIIRPNWKERDRFLAPYDKRMKSILRALWREEKRAVLANMRRAPMPAPPSKAIAIIGKAGDDSYIDQWLYPESKYVDAFADKVTSGLTPLVRAAILRAANIHDLTIAFEVVNRRALAWLEQYAPKLSWHVEQETLATLRDQLSAGIEAGENMDKLRKRVSETFGDMEDWRAERIARTETSRASGQGNRETWKEAGFTKKIWFANPDCCSPTGRPSDAGRTFCSELDGKVVDIDETFFAPDKYSDGLTEPAHCNCRCCSSAYDDSWGW